MGWNTKLVFALIANIVTSSRREMLLISRSDSYNTAEREDWIMLVAEWRAVLALHCGPIDIGMCGRAALHGASVLGSERFHTAVMTVDGASW